MLQHHSTVSVFHDTCLVAAGIWVRSLWVLLLVTCYLNLKVPVLFKVLLRIIPDHDFLPFPPATFIQASLFKLWVTQPRRLFKSRTNLVCDTFYGCVILFCPQSCAKMLKLSILRSGQNINTGVTEPFQLPHPGSAVSSPLTCLLSQT